MTKTLGFLVAAVILAVAVGGWFFPRLHQLVGAPAGSTFGDAKIASQTVAVATDTVFAIQNTEGSPRVIDSFKLGWQNSGATSTTATITCATSTVATGLNGNTNYVVSQSVNQIGTTTGTGGVWIASTSPGNSGILTSAASTTIRVWPANTYLVCKVTDSTGNTLNTLDAATTGFTGFNYFSE